MRVLRPLLLTAIIFGWLLVAHAQVEGESRLALVIGNATYKNSPLTNPVNDVRLMERTLSEAGFTVIKAENASRRDMQRLIRDFGEKLKQSGGVGLFYFAGHGVQVKGANYLVPIDADIRAEDEVAFDSIDAQSVLEKMETAKNRINLIILDACRDNPFAKGSRSASAGLATMSAPSGSLVAYSTAPGSVASDGSGKNGLYTQHLAAVMRMPDLPIEDVFKRVRAGVRKDSANQQTPWENTALEGNFYFKKSTPTPVAALAVPMPAPAQATPSVASQPAPNMMAVELAYWDSIKTSNRPFELEAYIEQFPNGSFVGLAKARLRSVADELAKTRAAQTTTLALAAPTSPSPNSVKAITTTPTITSANTSGLIDLVQGQQLGTLKIVDRVFNTSFEIKVAVLEKTKAHTLFSSGDKVNADGKVIQARFGENLVTLKQGELWHFPLKAGDKGKASIKIGNSDGDVEWQIKPDSASGSFIVQAEFRFILLSMSGSGRYGVWTGSYDSNQMTPVASKYTQFGSNQRPTLITTSLEP